MIPIKKSHLILFGLVFAVIVLASLFVFQGRAAAKVASPSCGELTRWTWEGGIEEVISEFVNVGCSAPTGVGSQCHWQFSNGGITYDKTMTVLSWQPSLDSASGETVQKIVCAAPAPKPQDPPPAATMILSDVCEPNDGFSDAGQMTLDSSDRGAVLKVAASRDGPWMPFSEGRGPWVLTRAQVEALAAAVGLTDYHDLWIKACPDGQVFNLGSMIRDRESREAQLCGTTK